MQSTAARVKVHSKSYYSYMTTTNDQRKTQALTFSLPVESLGPFEVVRPVGPSQVVGVEGSLEEEGVAVAGLEGVLQGGLRPLTRSSMSASSPLISISVTRGLNPLSTAPIPCRIESVCRVACSVC